MADGNEIIGERIAEQRKKKGYTQEELARLIGVDRARIGQWENGNREAKAGTIASLADSLETTCDYLLRGVETQRVDVHRQFGLSNEAISCLEAMSSSGMSYLRFNGVTVLDALNRILSTQGGIEILRLIGIYFNGDFEHPHAIKNSMISVSETIEGVSIQTSASTYVDIKNDALSDAILVHITNLLHDMRKEWREKNAQKV